MAVAATIFVFSIFTVHEVAVAAAIKQDVILASSFFISSRVGVLTANSIDDISGIMLGLAPPFVITPYQE